MSETPDGVRWSGSNEFHRHAECKMLAYAAAAINVKKRVMRSHENQKQQQLQVKERKKERTMTPGLKAMDIQPREKISFLFPLWYKHPLPCCFLSVIFFFYSTSACWGTRSRPWLQLTFVSMPSWSFFPSMWSRFFFSLPPLNSNFIRMRNHDWKSTTTTIFSSAPDDSRWWYTVLRGFRRNNQ